MTTEVERAAQRMFGPGGLGVKNFNLFPGTNPNATTEQVAAELNRALDRLEAGEFEMVDEVA
jgi:hypothetical protein